MKLCLNGVTRIVVLIGPWAFKVPRFNYGWQNFLRGLLCNMQEACFSKTKWPELCPVVFRVPGGWLTVMRRALPLSEGDWLSFDYENFRVGQDWPTERVVEGHYCADYYVPVENKIDSFGLLNGRVVAVDYGS